MDLKRLARFGGLMALLVTLAGCFEVSTVVSVKPDGSGTVSERMLMSRESLSQMKSLGDGDKKEKQGGMPEKEALEKKSGEYGEGVSFVGVHPVRTKTHEGYEAVYAFTDISKLKVSQTPDTASSSDSSSGSAPKKQKEYVRFKYEKGTPSGLLVELDQKKEKAGGSSSAPAKPATTPEQQKMAVELMKQFFKGMRVFLAVDIEGGMTSTNATYRKGNRITLVDMDFDKLMVHPKQFAAFNALGPDPSPEEMQRVIGRIPGLKIEARKELEVRFR
ncbi:MAG: hypothetical protein HGA26_01010 [Chlorobiaceae bacterium]|nr:hypothetical protein [Chlorobiaceae bacterium]